MVVCVGLLKAAVIPPVSASPSTTTLSIVGTSDLHGYFEPRDGRGGLAVFAGYVNNLRAARAADGGALLLLDAGDTFQGGVESDLSEGAVVVDAYNALGYTALAVGNHEFDFGAADRPGARQDPTADPRGALKARAAQAHFPFLAANLIDETTGERVDWPNVHPSVLVDAAGVKVGIIGMMTSGALRATLPLNVRGLRLAPLVETVSSESSRLRASGAQVVILVAHAGGGCDRFDDPHDLSSCDPNAEIFELARGVAPGALDAIVAGHTHAGLAHEVAGIPIVQSYWGGRAFGRIDLTLDRRSGRVLAARPFAPQDICASRTAGSGVCAAPADPTATQAAYEGRAVAEDLRIARAMEPALAEVRRLQATPLGVVIDRPLPRTGDPESPLGNLYADALREQSQADVALNNNSLGGLRADLPDGPITFGHLYDTFPFDNRLARANVSAGLLEQALANALRRGRRGTFGISGARVRVTCDNDGLHVRLFRPDGRPMDAREPLVVVGMDSLLGGQMFAPVIPPASLHVAPDAPIVREVVEDWLRGHRRIGAAQYLAANTHRLEFDGPTEPCLTR